jgi:eukaryotic-like serine/threonine-protein kinase
MGEVYRARDPRLAREVAVKVLPEDFLEGEERKQRFEREARLLAALNHPGIAAIYSFEEIPGSSPSSPGSSVTRHVLVMELVEGEDLAQRLTSGPLSLEESLSYAKQIAEALEAAHEKGIVHRDLKPSNVKITPEGRVKLLDFGLAKIFEAEPSGSSPSISYSPTLTARATAAGVILGTAAYMSPEQARGKTVDKRTDVWAFGCVLYEMLAGKRAFEGETVSDTLAAILRGEPDWAALPEQTPAAVRKILRRCLQRDARLRLHDIADARIELEESQGATSLASATGASSASGQSPFEEKAAVPSPTVGRSDETRVERGSKKILSLVLPWAIAAAFAAAAGALALRSRAPEQRVFRSALPPPEGTTFWLESNGPGPAVVSPDGRQVAFTAADGAGKVNLYVRGLDSREARALSGAEGAQYPFWSPDGRALGFFVAGKLKTIEVAGGSPLALCAAPEGKGGTWSQAGVIVFAPGPTSPLFKVSEKGGEATAITKLDAVRGDDSHRHPRFLSDGRHFLYIARSQKTAAEGHPILVASLDGGAEKTLLRSIFAASYASGQILYVRETTLMARPFDAARLSFTGDAVPVADKILTPATGTAIAVFSASQNGVLVYQTARGEATTRLQWFTRDGKLDGVLGEPAAYRGAVLSPDGKQAVATIRDPATGTSDLWIFDIARGVRTRFTFDPGEDRDPLWSPDGGSVVFSSNRKGHLDLYRKALDGSAEEEVIFASEADKYPASWTAGGRTLLFFEDAKDSGIEIRTLALDGARKPESWLRTKFNEIPSQLSPDGRWLPFSSDESGRWEVYVTSFPRAGRKWQISAEGGAYAFWSADGKEILYHDLSGMIRAVAVSARGDSLEIGQSRPMFRAEGPSPAGPAFSPTADHQRFLVVGEGQKPNALLDLVVNWTADLRGKK